MTEDSCGNCRWASEKKGKEMITCEVDMPPFVATWPGYRKTLVAKAYLCGLHKRKKDNGNPD